MNEEINQSTESSIMANLIVLSFIDLSIEEIDTLCRATICSSGERHRTGSGWYRCLLNTMRQNHGEADTPAEFYGGWPPDGRHAP